jgi:hypothetical protein
VQELPKMFEMVGGDRNHSLDLSEFSLMIQKIATAEWKKTELTYAIGCEGRAILSCEMLECKTERYISLREREREFIAGTHDRRLRTRSQAQPNSEPRISSMMAELELACTGCAAHGIVRKGACAELCGQCARTAPPRRSGAPLAGSDADVRPCRRGALPREDELVVGKGRL